MEFFLDPLYEAHWNNLINPIHFELTLPDRLTATPSSGKGPDVEAESDDDPQSVVRFLGPSGKASERQGE